MTIGRSKTYIINISPIHWIRAGRNGTRIFDAQKRDKVNFGIFIAQQHGNEPLFEGPLFLEIVFYIPAPRAHPKFIGKLSDRRPDLDNFEKFLMDVGTKILFNDDCKISGKFSYKVFDKNPRTEFTLTELKSIENMPTLKWS